MQQICANSWCKQSFEVTEEDLAFYDKISPVFAGKKYPIPAPTQCPDCRMQRRFARTNERRLYRRTSSKSGEDIISTISPDKPFLVYDQKEWWSDDWDPLSYGQPFDEKQAFFEQFHRLFLAVPQISLVVDGNENSEYVQYSGWDKNCYLCFCTDYSQDCLYTHSTYYSKNAVDTYSCQAVELCYECVHCRDCYHLLFSQNCANCSDSALLFDCANCKNCFGCVGLRGKEHCLWNTQMTKEEYERAIQAWLPVSAERIENARAKMVPLLAAHPRRALIGQQNENVSGDYLNHCKNAHVCFDCTDLEDCQFCTSMRGAKDCRDISHWGHPAELCYDSVAVGEGATRALFCECCWPNCSDLLYCCYCNSCSDCFGCVGLRHKRYCIFNRQYKKDEYDTVVPTIIDHMRSAGEWGEFFPVQSSMFDYNETMAMDYFPLSKSEAESRGWRWSSYEAPVTDVKNIIPAAQLPAAIADVPDDILAWAIECKVTQKPFRIVRAELECYRREGLPLPHVHPDERCRRRIALRNPRRLWSRHCAKCSAAIQTTYAPDRPEIVYCEECYLKEVY